MPKIRNSWGLFLNQRNVHKYSQQLIQQQLSAEDSQVHPCALVIQWTQRVGFSLTHSLTSKTSAYFLNFSLIGSLKYKTPPKTIHRTWPIIHDQLAPWPQEQEFFSPLLPIWTLWSQPALRYSTRTNTDCPSKSCMHESAGFSWQVLCEAVERTVWLSWPCWLAKKALLGK